MLAVPYLFQSGLSHFFQSPFNAYLAGLMPLPLFRTYCYLLGISYFVIRKDHRQQVATSVLSHMGNKAHRLEDLGLLWKTYRGILEHYIEKMVNAYHPLHRLTHHVSRNLEIRNEAWLIDALGQNRGLLMASGHFGAVEYLPLVLSLKGFKPAIVARFKTEKLRNTLFLRASLFNITSIDADLSNAAFRALEAIRQGHILITLCDEFSHWKPNRERVISVFGNSVRQDKTLDLLYRRCKPPACMGLLQRRSKGFTLHIDPIANGDPSISLSERAWRKMEQYINRYPEQWYQWQQVADRLAAYRLKE